MGSRTEAVVATSTEEPFELDQNLWIFRVSSISFFSTTYAMLQRLQLHCSWWLLYKSAHNLRSETTTSGGVEGTPKHKIYVCMHAVLCFGIKQFSYNVCLTDDSEMHSNSTYMQLPPTLQHFLRYCNNCSINYPTNCWWIKLWLSCMEMGGKLNNCLRAYHLFITNNKF